MKNKKGFTLIEVLVVALLAGIVGLGTINAIAQSNKLLNENTTVTMANANTHLIFNEIAKDVKEGVGLRQGTQNVWSMVIHYADSTKVEWKYKLVDGAYIPLRISRTNTQRTYKPVFYKENNNYKYFLPKFYINQDTNTKYNNVDITMRYYNPSSSFVTELAKAKYYCKHDAKLYGY